LKAAGYCGLSTFGVRKVTIPDNGVVQINTHADIIDWKGTRGFCGEESALGQATRHLAAKRTGKADVAEPTGWLSHHAVHDVECWHFLEKLFDWTRTSMHVTWRSAASLFPVTERK
jgi:hypothetical protein